LECCECEAAEDNYGSGVYKFHLFCDIFSIPGENQRLSALLKLLPSESFALWADTDRGFMDPHLLTLAAQFELVSASVVRKYLAAVRA
jgi:hypothetical protein